MRCLIAFALFCSASAFGAGTVPEPEGLWTGEVHAPVPATLRGGTVVNAKAVDDLLKRGRVVVVDVAEQPRRPAQLAAEDPWIPLPHPALPGALWMPGVGAGVLPSRMEEFYRDELAQATHGDFATPIVIYCHSRCWLSWNAAKRAIGFGYTRVHWFADGVEGWIAAGLPTVVATAREPTDEPASNSERKQASPKLVILNVELSGDLGGPEFTAEHDARLKTESARLREDLARTNLYQILDNTPAQGTIDRLEAQQQYLHDCNGCDLDVGRELGADFVLVTWVDRVSGLILTLTYEIHDVKTNQITARKSYDFRGDSDIAWNHAIDYMVRDLAAGATTVSEH